MRVGVVGASGQVGTVMRSVLEERKFPVSDIRFFGSARSAGSSLRWRDELVSVEDAASADFSGLEIVLMSSGATASRALAPKIAGSGALVIDNSSAWRMDPEVPLIVAEVNAHELDRIPKGIIANPNCTTMAAMGVLQLLNREAGLLAITVSTYQAVSGSGRDGVAELAEQLESSMSRDVRALTFDGSSVPVATPVQFPAPIAHNVIPIAGTIVADGRRETNEEQKFRNESRKILGLEHLLVSVTCVRVPVFTGHSMSITASFESPLNVARAIELLESGDGIVYCEMPTPLTAAGRDETFVGRVREAESVPNGLSLFLASDNLRKGAALNAVQIAEAWLAR